MCDLVPFVQFKNLETKPCRSAAFSKVAGFYSATLLKVTLFHRCFSRFLKEMVPNRTKQHSWFLGNFVETSNYSSTWSCFESSTVLTSRDYTWYQVPSEVYQYMYNEKAAEHHQGEGKGKFPLKACDDSLIFQFYYAFKLWNGIHKFEHIEIERLNSQTFQV